MRSVKWDHNYCKVGHFLKKRIDFRQIPFRLHNESRDSQLVSKRNGEEMGVKKKERGKGGKEVGVGRGLRFAWCESVALSTTPRLFLKNASKEHH